MKTFNEIDKEISTLEAEGKAPKQAGISEKTHDKNLKKIGKRLQFLRSLKAYLQENPQQEDLIEHLKKLENKRNLINDPANFNKWLYNNPGKTNDLKKSKAEYQKELELPHINSQIKTLKYLLE